MASLTMMPCPINSSQSYKWGQVKYIKTRRCRQEHDGEVRRASCNGHETGMGIQSRVEMLGGDAPHRQDAHPGGKPVRIVW